MEKELRQSEHPRHPASESDQKASGREASTRSEPPARDARASGITPKVVAGEIRGFARAHERRRRLFPRAALVGLIAGFIAVLFRRALEAVDLARNALIDFSHLHPSWGFVLPVIFGAIGAAGSVWLVQRFAPEASGSGIPHLKAVLHRLRSLKWYRILPVKFLGGVLAIGGGLTLGREGPTVQMGGAVGQMVSRWLGSTARERRTLIASGAGAGLSAAFNAPLAGVIFVLEEVQRDFTPSVFTATFVACVVGDIVARLMTGQLPVFHVTSHPIASLSSLPLFLVLGVLAGVLGVAFNRALLATLRLFERAGRYPRYAVAGVIGAGVGLFGWFMPDTLGSGHHMVEQTLAGKVGLSTLLLLFVVRFTLTMFSYGTGAPGGIFAPLLVLGAQIGMFVGLLAGELFPRVVPEPTMFAVVGMGAYFTAIVRAPLTGIVLIIEMTGNYWLLLPLLVSCFCAYGVADLLQDRPIYEALLERDLLRSQDAPELEDTLLLELPVYAGSNFDGKIIRELNLPTGCLIVTVQRGVQSLVATSDTKLQADDRITAVIAPEAAAAAALLREGTSSD